MKLANKLSLALLLAVMSVVAAFAALRIQREVALLDNDIRRDHRIIGVTAAAAVHNLSSREAVQLVKRVDASRDNVDIKFVSWSPEASADLRPVVPSSGTPAQHQGILQVERDLRTNYGTGKHLATLVPAPVTDDPRAAIQLAEPLATRVAYVRNTALTVVFSSLLMALVCGAVAVPIGARLVSRPIRELISATDRIGAGHFEVAFSGRRSDELGELARAIERMSGQLADARHRMQEETEARIRAVEQLRHADRLATLGQLASVLAHEIGTPLNVIAGHAKMIASGRSTGQEAAESARAMAEQCERMTSIVRRILDYARRRPPKRVEVNLQHVVSNTCDLLRSLAERGGVLLSFQSEPELLVNADPGQLQQALTNIVLNAIQASGSGDMVHVVADRAFVKPTPLPIDKSCIRIRVIDHGPGIPDAIRPKIFEPFFTTKAPGEGTGLGLSIANEIITEHGGACHVDSANNRGTSFEVYLPQ